MAEWRKHSEYWLVRNEGVSAAHSMVCYARPQKYVANNRLRLFGVVAVYDHEENYEERIELLIGSGLLELECIAREMRKKYKSS